MTAFTPDLRRLIAVLLLGGMIGLLDGTIVAVGAETLADHFDTDLATIGWASTGYLLAVTVAIPLTAWAGERFGTRRLWLAGLGLFLVGSVAAGLAWDVPSLIAARVVQGLGGGTLEPVLLTLLARAAGPARAGRVMGLMGVVLSLGPVLGPIVGGVVLEALDWRWMFFVAVPVGLVSLVFSARLLPHEEPGQAPPFDVVGLALLAPGFTGCVYALSRGDAVGIGVLGVVLLGVYVAHALRVRSPLIDVRLFGDRGFAASVVVMTAVGACLFSVLFAVPLAQQADGRGVLAAGLAVAPYGLGSALAMPLAGRLSDTVGTRALAVGGAAVGLLCAVGMAVGAPVWSTFFMGAGLGAVGASTMGSLYRTLPVESVAQGSSGLFILNQLGGSLGVAVVSALATTAGTGAALWWVAGLAGVITLATPLLPGRVCHERLNTAG
ncbi:DHA2 family efflux MFS transporter permease subunit [Actinokineospora pegani]|uniref:DHA2 family efflux MFS transporter permease subunit n=1 Tax=Actinokineospora pegani TaxID=2654637 RepID=UPI0012EA4C1C|nr:DHA2 family efflux MFS transporter permease subunit [Actinokineospora pegani]